MDNTIKVGDTVVSYQKEGKKNIFLAFKVWDSYIERILPFSSQTIRDLQYYNMNDPYIHDVVENIKSIFMKGGKDALIKKRPR